MTIIGTILVFGGLMNLQLAYADGPTPPPPLTDATFDVGKTLKLEDQDGAYFKKTDTGFEKDRSPIVKAIVNIIEFVTKIIGSVAIILIILGGLILVVSQGEQTMIDKGKEIIKFSFFGLMIVFASYTIGIFIQSIFYAS